jgi:mRNA interferase RelE/StbE
MKVRLHPVADKYYKRLNEPAKGQIKGALDDLEKEPPEGDIVPLTEKKGCYRVKVGGYRIIYHVEDGVILVTHIQPRGQAYSKKFKSR